MINKIFRAMILSENNYINENFIWYGNFQSESWSRKFYINTAYSYEISE